jgi:pimeloyl-ACP methyl ester carboxylesterase
VHPPQTQFYTWKTYRCAYEVHQPEHASGTPLLPIHPIGVGLSRHFWQRFIQTWKCQGYTQPIYNPDLLGCGESDMPKAAYTPEDWANQLQYFIKTEIKKPVILVVQGALYPVAIALAHLQIAQNDPEQNWIRGLVLACPPAWAVMTEPAQPLQQKLIWNLLFDSPIGTAFYRYARREQFLRSFSIRQLFESAVDVDREWLDMLNHGAESMASRHAVFAFLAGFWRKDYAAAIAQMTQPTLIVFGERASGISKPGKNEPAQQRLTTYLDRVSNSQGTLIPGRNVLPYESTQAFVEAIAPFINSLEALVDLS